MRFLDTSGLLKGTGGVTEARVAALVPGGASRPISRRLSAVRSLAKTPGATIITGPLGAHFWRVLPATVSIRVEPDGYYDAGPRYADNPLKWALLGLGVPSSTASALCKRKTPPTPKHKHYRQWTRARKVVERLEAAAPNIDVGPGMAAVRIVDAQAANEYLFQAPRFSWDTETTPDGTLAGISLAVEGKPPVYVPFEQAVEFAQVFLPNRLKAQPNVAHNLKHDIKVIARTLGCMPSEVVSSASVDTMVMAWLVQDHVRESHHSLGLKDLTQHYTHDRPLQFKDVCPTGDFRDVPLELAAMYSGADAVNALILWPIMAGKVTEDGLEWVWEHLERPLIPILADMEVRGFPVDLDWFVQKKQQLEAGLKVAEAHLPFNPNSPAQVGAYFYDKEGLPVHHLTPGGGRSVDEQALLSFDHPTAALLRAYRGRAKLLSTYVLPILEKNENIVHSTFNQCARDDFGGDAAPATGRLASSDPNLQNIPLDMREGFVPPEGMVLYAADYSQIELRLMAVLSQDQGMLAAYREGRDIHAELAARMWNVEITDDLRRKAKTGQFLMQYGGGPSLLAEKMGLSKDAAKMLWESIRKARPEAVAWTLEAVALARKHGYAETIMGRKRWVPDIDSGWPEGRSRAEREAVNAVVQGSAADIIKLAMRRVDRLHKEMGGAMINQVHDEIVGWVDDKDRAWLVGNQMMHRYNGMDFPADVGTGSTWLAAKK
jgi:DNA polymerase I